MKIIYTFVIFILLTGISEVKAQSASTIPNNEADTWWNMMQDPNGNFYAIQSKFNQYWENRDINEKGKGYKQFKRWENFVERRCYPSGDLTQLNLTAKNYTEWLQNNSEHIYQGSHVAGKFSSNAMTASSTWTAIGPMGPISGSAGGQLLKSGRLNFISISPTNSNVLFVGAPCGGLWRSTNGGTSWTTNTDNLPVTGFSDHAFDPTNTNIMYAANGDGDAGDSYCTNVYKSTDGGNTWNTTGLTFNVTSGVRIRRLIVNPSNPQIVMAGGSMGIRRSTDGGTTWTSVSTTNTYDLEFKPGDPNTVYAGGTTFRRSTDGGVTWTTIAGVPASGTSNRLAIAVTPANANYVYVLASNNSGSGFLGFLQSTNSGASFTNITTTLNLLGWASAGNDTGGQGWYDLCIAASPTNAAEVVVGGVNVWRTTNSGGSWSLYGHWTGSGAPFTHADHHDLEYASNGTLFNANDGTVYRRTATLWQEISGTMNISQIYKIGLATLSNLWITGHQDNGTSSWNGTTYTARIGGDGMDCFIDRTNSNNMFGETQYGGFRKSTNGGTSWSSCTTGMSGTAPWVTIWKQDPVTASRLYAGRQNMFVSNDQAGNWTQLTALPAAGSVVEFAIAPSNNQVLYVIKNNNIFKTTNGGTSWSTITGTIPVGSAGLQNVCISPTDANKVWVCSGNYSNGNKVWYSSNGGTTWTNWSSNLPNLPANCLFYQPGSSDRVYVGMDVGVYYRDPSTPNWTLYNTGLPNTPVSDMETSNAFLGKIVAATYGRGVWIVDFAPSALPPVTSFAFSGTLCAGVAKVFNDNSINGPTSWSWSVTPSAGVTINTPSSQSPTITFANPGNYVVAMTASNTNGPGNTHTLAVTVNTTPVISVASSANSVCAGSPVTFTASGANTYTWSFGPTTPVASVSPTITTTYSVNGTSAAGCVGVSTKSVVVQPSVTVNTSASSTNICSPASATINATGATTYTWQPGNLNGSSVVVSPSTSTNYTVTGTSGSCNGSKVVAINVGQNPNVTASSSSSLICAGTAATLTANGASTYSWSTGPTTSTLMVFPSMTTTYAVTGYSNGCSSTFTILVSVQVCNLINELTIGAESYKAFPNPFANEINFTTNEEVSITIYDQAGRIVKQDTINKEGSIATTDLASGVYIVYMKGNSGIRTLRLVKEKN